MATVFVKKDILVRCVNHVTITTSSGTMAITICMMRNASYVPAINGKYF